LGEESDPEKGKEEKGKEKEENKISIKITVIVQKVGIFLPNTDFCCSISKYFTMKTQKMAT
jgi:flagellar basal body L-ring protein FlgH